MLNRLHLWLLRCVALGLCLASSGTACAQAMRVHFIDVGQGAATLIEFPCAAMLIDTGGEDPKSFDSPAALMKYLDRFFETRPELQNTLHSLVITHPHIDHTRGVDAVLGRYRVRNAIVNGRYPRAPEHPNQGDRGQVALYKAAELALETLDRSDDIEVHPAWVSDIPKGKGLTSPVIDPIQCDDIDPKITLLWGTSKAKGTWTKKAFENQNNHSVVLRIDFGKSSMLITGDLQEEAIGSMVEHYRGTRMLDVNLYQVGHHGSHNATTDALMQAVTPDIAVIATGAPARVGDFTAFVHGHPRWVTVEKLIKHVRKARPTVNLPVAFGQRSFYPVPISKAIYATGWDGNMVFEATRTGIWKLLPLPEEENDEVADGGPPPPLNINTATEEELVQLPMIGTTKARAIVDYRTTQGPFPNPESVIRVPGIGPSTLRVIRNLITTGS